MSEKGESTEFGLFGGLDVIALAKDLQWDISITEDPAEASLKSSAALADIYRIDDKRIRAGNIITLKIFGAYILDVSLESGQKATAQLDEMVIQGKSGGMGFIQNLGNPRIQTLFLAIRQARTLEANEEDGIWVSKLGVQPLVVPVLDIESITATAA